MKAPAFQFYARDFLVSTAIMSAEEVGAYIRLLCYSWDNGSLPDDLEVLARLGGCSSNAAASIRHKFSIDAAGKLMNARLEKTRAQQREYSEKQAKKARERWNHTENEPDSSRGNAVAHAAALPEGMPQGCSATPTASATPTDTPILNAGSSAAPQPAQKRRAPIPKPTDAEWISSLKEGSAYAGINVEQEFDKCVKWFAAKSITVTRPRFLNWLNRVPRPINGVKKQGASTGEFDHVF